MDIKSGSGYPASALSNFSPHRFVFDGVECASFEGFLQSLKFDKPHIQAEVCRLTGHAAKIRGAKRNAFWKRYQCLWWKGKKIDRHGDEYQKLLDRAYEELARQSESFRRALLSTGRAVLKHSSGKANPKETVLTQTEFVSRLTRIRDRSIAPHK